MIIGLAGNGFWIFRIEFRHMVLENETIWDYVAIDVWRWSFMLSFKYIPNRPEAG